MPSISASFLMVMVFVASVVKNCLSLRIAANDWSSLARNIRSVFGSLANLPCIFSAVINNSAIVCAFHDLFQSSTLSPMAVDILFHNLSPSLNCGPRRC